MADINNSEDFNLPRTAIRHGHKPAVRGLPAESLDQEAKPESLSPADTQDDSKRKPEVFSPKLLLVFISFLALASLIFAAGNWFDSLKIGFAIRGDLENEFSNANYSLKDSDVANTLALQEKDTDLDGLSDYDELYFYRSSPYIADSDSDGFSDFEEVKSNENPNCPAGQSCVLTAPDSSEVAASPFEGLSDLTVEQIKQLLLESGAITEEDLAKIDDQALMALYSETLQDIIKSGPAGSAEAAPEQSLDLITPEQLRAILKDQEGINPADVDALTDEELMQIWQEIMAEEGQ
ncbi:hypothetical protein KJ840_03980 [Patescibacteria group bacterium]|nr:hypothetical protein [Patescibacteria group bacterium]